MGSRQNQRYHSALIKDTWTQVFKVTLSNNVHVLAELLEDETLYQRIYKNVFLS